MADWSGVVASSGRRGLLEQVPTAFLSSFEAFLMLPLSDLCVISLDKNIGNLHSAEFPWSSELRVFEEAGMTEGIIAAAGFIMEYTRDEPDDGIDDHHGRDFPAVTNEISDGDFGWSESLSDTIIEAFVASAENEEPWFFGELFDEVLVEFPAGRRHHEQPAGFRGYGLHGFDAVEDGLTHDEHSWAASEGLVVHLLVLSGSKVAEVVQADIDERLADGPFEMPLAKIALEHLREQSEDIELDG